MLINLFRCLEKPRYISLLPSSLAFSFFNMTSIEGRETKRATKYMQLSFYMRADSILWVAVSIAFANGIDWAGAGTERIWRTKLSCSVS